MDTIKYIFIPLLAALLSQIIKVIIEYIKYRKISIKRFTSGMGGMPSTHSTLVSSLCTLVYLKEGLSLLFIVTFIFSLIIIYDAMGVRYESGRQASTINKLVGSNLNENIGHKPIEVFVGVILGILVTIIFMYYNV